jgi:chlorobactene glucosyltransferase
MMPAVLLALPWVVFPFFVARAVRRRPRLAEFAPRDEPRVPRVSVIVPARNEEETIGTCVASLRRSGYRDFEVIVVDDGSEDATASIVAGEAASDPRVRLVAGAPLPAGWFGKPWACVQGAAAATGEYLLFTDADVVHEPQLVGRSVRALEETGAGMVSIAPRQLLPGFWERLIMPQVLLLILLRYPDPERVNASDRTRDKIANGQFILVRRDAYDDVGGHSAVRHEVAEDLRLAQAFHARGHRVFLAVAEEFMAVRMYRSLGGIVEGWSKNVAIGSRHSVPAPIRPLVPWLLVLWLTGTWLAPPTALAAGAAGAAGRGWLVWGGVATAASTVLWAGICGRLGVPVRYAFAYPAGAAAAAMIFLKSAVQGGRVRWKGRAYRAGEAAVSR